MSLAALQEKWRHEYPGESIALVSLRDNLAHAEHRRDLLRATFQNLEQDLAETWLPMHHWNRPTQRHYLFFEKLQSRTQREFIKAFQLLHGFLLAAQPKASALSKREPSKPPEIVYDKKGAALVQMVTIRAVDGKVVTTVDPGPEHWLTGDTLPIAAEYQRHFYFPDSVIPEPYSWLLTHEGVTYPPTDAIFIGYSPEEFMRLCQLELDTHSEYLLDGDRLRYERLPTS